MLHDWKMNLYWCMPVRLQEAALGIYAKYLDRVYYGPKYQEWREWALNWRSWSRNDIGEWKKRRLRQIVQLAAAEVPFYRNAWKGRLPASFGSESDLQALPFLEKQSIRKNELAFIAEGRDPRSLWVQKTSGTTGTSLKIYWPKSMLPLWWAVTEVRVRYVAGVAQEMPRAMMGGRPVVAGSSVRPPFWRFNRQWKQLYMSSYHVSPKTSPHYISALRKYGSLWIIGYGSAIAALAESALEAGVEPYPVQSVITSGDTLLPGMRRLIEMFFRCKCFDFYGQAEGVAMAMECSQGKMHTVPMAGIIEVVREDGSLCRPGETGEIVATGLLNDAMPLVRYRTGDYACWSEEQDCPCGNPSPVIRNLEGRVDDYLETSDGRRIGRLSTAFKRSPSIHSAQLLQDRVGHAVLLVRPGEGYRRADAEEVRDDILERIGRFELEIMEVSEIPKTMQGKTALVVRLNERPLVNGPYDRILGKRISGVSIP